ncbi:hypothetical protein BKA62DRAFT_788482 [Auriculariales sp. MPI-PUGE-AT-0066]|nr:hypothetical protein BKA62DRAFT_788482 [Auriculariales sp. MPI-PUGE-AT-0066]
MGRSPMCSRPSTSATYDLIQRCHKQDVTRNAGHVLLFRRYIRTCALAGGRIMVVVEPMPAPRAETERDYTILAHKREAELHYQRVVTVGLWNPPGTKIDALHILIRSGMLKAITGGTVPWTGWGLRGYLRLAPLESKIIANHAAGCKIAGVAYEACWSLLALGTDPEAEGRGLGSLAIREGLAHIDALGAPCTLEATKARPKAIYERFGWKESGSVPCGAGEVDEAGLAPAEKHTSKAELTGFTLWTMLRLPLRIATTNVSSAHVPLDDLN